MSALIFLVISAWGEEIYSVFYLNWLIIRGFYLNLQKTKGFTIPHMKRIFDETDIPYDILSKYGLSQQMIDDLPEQAMDSLLGGCMTPSTSNDRER